MQPIELFTKGIPQLVELYGRYLSVSRVLHERYAAAGRAAYENNDTAVSERDVVAVIVVRERFEYRCA